MDSYAINALRCQKHLVFLHLLTVHECCERCSSAVCNCFVSHTAQSSGGGTCTPQPTHVMYGVACCGGPPSCRQWMHMLLLQQKLLSDVGWFPLKLQCIFTPRQHVGCDSAQGILVPQLVCTPPTSMLVQMLSGADAQSLIAATPQDRV